MFFFYSQAKSLVCAPMENCFSNLMHDDGKGLLSLILSLIGLNVSPSCFLVLMSKPEHVPLPCCLLVFRAAWMYVVPESELCLLQITTSLEQVREFLSATLLYVQQRQLCAEKSLWEVVQQCVDLLKDNDLITVAAHSHGQTLQVTKLGKATYKGESP